MSTTTDIKRYINRSFLLEDMRLDDVKKILSDVLAFLEFEIKETTESSQNFRIVAKYGTKSRAFLTGMFIPYGNHLPEGKRFFFEAQASTAPEGVNINLRIVPFMELLDHEEIFLLTQDVTEKFSDDFVAAVAFRDIVRNVCVGLGLEVPDEFRQFKHKRAFWDHFWGTVVYPFDSYKSSKRIHTPSEPGPKWSWGAFALPEIWFLANDIVGLAFLAFIIDCICLQVLIIPTILLGLPWLVLGIPLFVTSRIFFGRIAQRSYYMRWGYWKGNKTLNNEQLLKTTRTLSDTHQVQRIKFDSSSAEVLNSRGISYGEKDEYDLAIADFTKAIEIDPDYAYSYFNRALAFEEQGKKLEAINDYRKFLVVTNGRTRVKDATLAIEQLTMEIASDT